MKVFIVAFAFVAAASGFKILKEADSICPSSMEHLTLLPHEDCTKFYSCVWGTPVEMDCAPGTHFNPSLMVCDWPENAGCTGTGGSGSGNGNGSGNDSSADCSDPEPEPEPTPAPTTTEEPVEPCVNGTNSSSEEDSVHAAPVPEILIR